MGGDNDIISDFFEEHPKFADTNFSGPASPDDLFSIFESLDAELTRLGDPHHQNVEAAAQKNSICSVFYESETEFELEAVLASPSSSKRPKLNSGLTPTISSDGQQKVSHITVERNRRKQMNEHLTVLRSLMPCFYVKRGDQASIIGGVIDYINELQQVLQSLESKKRRKAYTEAVLSQHPIMSPSPRPSPLSPRPKPPLSPRLNNLPISPRTPQSTSPYKPRLMQLQQPPSPSPTSSSGSSITDSVANELAANSKSAIADVEVKLSGGNLLLKTVSPRIPGQVLKIISALKELSLEILHVSISSVDETVVNSFTIKIGIECQFSADELAHQIQQTFHKP